MVSIMTSIRINDFFEKALLTFYSKALNETCLDVYASFRGQYCEGTFEFDENSKYYDGEFEVLDNTLEKVLERGSMRIFVKCRCHDDDELMEDGTMLAPFLPEEVIEVPFELDF